MADVKDFTAGNARLVNSVVGAPRIVAKGIVNAQGELQGAVTKPTTGVAMAAVSGEQGPCSRPSPTQLERCSRFSRIKPSCDSEFQRVNGVGEQGRSIFTRKLSVRPLSVVGMEFLGYLSEFRGRRGVLAELCVEPFIDYCSVSVVR